MDRLTRYVTHHRKIVIGIWVLLTAFGGFAAGQMTDRWLKTFSIPGYSAYEANQRTLQTLGSGEIQPYVPVFKSTGDVTQETGIKQAITSAAAATPGARVSSYFDAKSSTFVSADRHTMFALIYPPGPDAFDQFTLDPTKDALKAATPAGVTSELTGLRPLFSEASDGETGGGPSLLVETLIGGLGALVILFFTFGTLPAVAMPLVVAIAAIMNTFTLVWLMSFVTDISVVVQFLVSLVGLGVAIDYALLIIFRFREELRHGNDREAAIMETMRHAGHSVIVSGSTVAVGLISMIIIPLPFIRSIGIGGMLIPLVSVLASITLLPALLYSLGPRINTMRVLPKRLVEGSDDPDAGFWNKWGKMVMRRPIPVATMGAAIVAVLLFFGLQLNPSDAQAKDLPGAGTGHRGLTLLNDAKIGPGPIKPYSIVVEGPVAEGDLAPLAAAIGKTAGIVGTTIPPVNTKAQFRIIEAIPTTDGSAKPTRDTTNRLKDVAASASRSLPPGTKVTVAGTPPQEREFIKAVYGTFPWVLLFVVVLTYILLARAFRSLILPLKAVILNLVSLGAAYGIIVFIFQKGNGSKAIWNVAATDSIVSWIPIMIFAFLYGLSMDYEVFMLTRMREAYDEGGNTAAAVSLGLARTGKLVTSAALVLMFAFFVLSLSPGTDIKQFGIGLAAGIIFDATIIRALLVPALMRLLDKWNWWLPDWAAKVLRVKPSVAV